MKLQRFSLLVNILTLVVVPSFLTPVRGQTSGDMELARIKSEGRLLMDEQRVQDAIAVLDYGIRVAPRDHELYMLRADARAKLVQSPVDTYWTEAMKDYDASIKIRPTPKAYLRRAQLRHTWMPWDRLDILDDLQKALFLDPRNADALALRGAVLFMCGEVLAAKLDFDMALAIDPRNATALNNMGVTYDITGDIKTAIYYYTAAIKVAPDRARAYENRAGVLMDEGLWELALKDLNEAVRLRPWMFNYRDRAVVKKRLRDWEGALEDLTTAIEMILNWDEKKAELLKERAEVLRQLGHHTRADEDEKEAAALMERSQREKSSPRESSNIAN